MRSWAGTVALVGVLAAGLTAIPVLLVNQAWGTLAMASVPKLDELSTLFPIALALIGLTFVRALADLALQTSTNGEPADSVRPPEGLLWPSAPERKRIHDHHPLEGSALGKQACHSGAATTPASPTIEPEQDGEMAEAFPPPPASSSLLS